MIKKSFLNTHLTNYSKRFRSSSLNNHEIVFSLVRQLVHAQFELADSELTNRLWKDVAERGIDINRVINLMYQNSYEEEEMLRLDLDYLQNN